MSADEMPEWFTREFAGPLKSGLASVFIVHGDINCLVRNPDADDEPEEEYVPIRRFLEKVFDERELMMHYNIAPGLWTQRPEMDKLFRKVADIDDAKASGGDAVAAAKAGLAAKRGLPREPEACFPLIEKALRRVDESVLIVESAHTVAPFTGNGIPPPPNERAIVERIRIWARSTKVRANGSVVLLFTDQASKMSQELRLPDSEVRTVFIPKPEYAERAAFITWTVRSAKEKVRIDDSLRKGKSGLDVAVMARACQGMSLRQIAELFQNAKAADAPLSLRFVKDKKREMLNNEYGDVMEVIEPERGLEDIGGHEHIKTYFRGVLKAIREGENRLVPMGVTLMGPPGTGKTAIVEALAKEAGFNFVKTKSIRSMWNGESEARMEKFIAGLRSLAPVVVMNDEADLAEAGRDSLKGDSGVSERLMKMWMELLSDPRIRGKVIVINCTNRPDRMDAALKRSGRSDERILMPMPSETERSLIFKVMFKRHAVPSGIKDFKEFADCSAGLSGADIEAVVLGSFRFADEQGKKAVDAEALHEAVRDFIPSNNMTEIDGMTVAGLLECSSRRLLPPHIGEIIAGIRQRGLVRDFDGVLARLVDRKILPPSAIAAA